MSNRYKGAVISATPPTTSGGESGTASGVWTLEQQLQLTAASLWPIQPLPKFIEDVFSTYIYTGTGAAQTITNGINLSGNGGLVWIKPRTPAGYSHWLYDTTRGVNNGLNTDTTGAQYTAALSLTAFNTTGFSLGSDTTGTGINSSGITNVAWTFRKQPKFFDVVTYTGNSANGQAISHNLGSVPGCIITKSTSNTRAWWTYHRSTADGVMVLNTTAAKDTAYAYSYFGNDTVLVPPTSTQFTVGYNSGMNQGGETYVAYLFAHDAGGFGLLGTDNVISCGSFVTDGSGNATVSLGYEPQWLLMKNANGTNYNWVLMDTMRGWTANTSSSEASLYPNTTGAESIQSFGSPTATGFNASGWYATQTIIYIAIRRGPMAVPTVGTSVFSPVTRTGNGTTLTVTSPNFAPDALFSSRSRNNAYQVNGTTDKLRGKFGSDMSVTDAEGAFSAVNDLVSWSNVGYVIGINSGSNLNTNTITYIDWVMKRAPSMFDIVCYTGTGANTTFTHNLGVVPEMMIVKGRSVNANWVIYTAAMGATKTLFFTDSAVGTYSVVWNDTAPTSSVFSVGTGGTTNSSGGTYFAYLFATCPGVSKVGSYTGTGALLTVDCGFTTGARFVFIKRTDSTGDWYVWDSARGITAGDDPYVLLNSVANEVTNTNYVDTDATGFKVTAAAPAAINANGGTFIFLAIA